MFCPECQCEYREGFTHCSDCDVDLVDSLDESHPDAASGEGSGLREVWQGTSPEECGILAARLKAEQVPFQVLQSKDDLFKGVGQSFRVLVPEDVSDHAVALVAQCVAEWESQADDSIELPAEDDEPDDPRPRRARAPWHPEDATVEVSSGETPEFDEMIEASLRENEIRFTVEIGEDGSNAIFVAPEDESPAREIIREIKDATPRS